MLIGYARVSTRDQNLRLQIDALEGAKCDKIFEDKISGATKARPGLDDALSHLRAGDTLVVWKLDRLGRSAAHLVTFLDDLRQRGIHFRCLTGLVIDTATPTGRMLFTIAAAVAENDLEQIRERTRAGLEAAKARGLVGGRRKVLNDKKVANARTLLQDGRPPREVAETLGVSVATLYRYIPGAASIANEA